MDIEIKALYKSFGDKLVLNNINALFLDKKINCIMGDSGCGKTTLINILMGITKADSGSLLGLNQKVISAIFQEDRLCENLSLIKNIRLVCHKNISDQEIKNHIIAVGLGDYLYEPVYTLSGGMKRRVSIVRAIIYNSDIVIMDEPLKGLDEATKSIIIEYIKEYSSNKMLIVVTHDERETIKLGAEQLLNM